MTEGAPLNEAHTRARIDAVLFSTLAAAKREERSNQIRMSSSSTQSVRSVHLQFEKDIKMEWTFPNKQRWLVTGRTDYSLWYGEPGQIEANLVVCKAKRKGVIGVEQTLVYMGQYTDYFGFNVGTYPLSCYGHWLGIISVNPLSASSYIRLHSNEQ